MAETPTKVPGMLLAILNDEVARASSKFPAFNSHHEGYAIIQEELDEYWDVVKGKAPQREEEALGELIQVAAMAIRGIMDLTSWELVMVEAKRRDLRGIDLAQAQAIKPVVHPSPRDPFYCCQRPYGADCKAVLMPTGLHTCVGCPYWMPEILGGGKSG